MRRLLFFGLFGLALRLFGQRIETETDSQDRIVKVQTAMNHITLIEAPGDITRTAVGSKAFQVERQGNLVLIQPQQEGAATNLFVWVGDRRFNYELLPPVNDAGQMDFAIDYRRPVASASPASAHSPVVPNPASSVPADMLMNGTPVSLKGKFDSHEQVGLVIRDLYRTTDTVYIRYTLINRLDKPVHIGNPTVLALNDPHLNQSLLALEHTQLGTNLASKIKPDTDAVPLSLLPRSATPIELAPRHEQIGMLSIKLLAGPQAGTPSASTVLRISFPVDQAQPARTILIL